jgi:hypothetical protein
MPIITLGIGPQSGTTPQQRGGISGETVVVDLRGKYYERSVRKAQFVAFALAQTLTMYSAGSNAYTGLQLYNQSVNTNLLLNKVAVQVSVTSATMTGILLTYGFQGVGVAPTSQTAATASISGLLGAAKPAAGLPLTAGTFVNQAANIWPLIHNTAAINTVGIDYFNIDFEDMFIIPPGFYIALGAQGAASAASAVTAGIAWEEVTVPFI